MTRRPWATRVAAAVAACVTATVMHVPLGPPLLAQRVLYDSPAFRVTDRSVEQGPFSAQARGRDSLASSYPRAAPEVRFKFGIGGQDDEFPPGTEHTVSLRPTDGRFDAGTYVFGRLPAPRLIRPEPGRDGDDGPATFIVRLDLRSVRDSLRARGAYVTPTGTRVTTLDPVYVIGDGPSLTWDVGALRPGMPQQLTDPDGDGIYEARIPMVAAYTRPRGADGLAVWGRSADLARFPELASPEPLLDALHRLSLEELTQLVRPDGALSAGAKWPGVWTRDVSFAAVLALAIAAPDAVKASLRAKVDADGRVIQDTGTGGSWPVSTDRTTWALAAWEVYAVTGDTAWLREAHDVLARSVEADRHAAVDRATGLMLGESSFLDWREQSYPRWMQPADIYASQALGTNAVHHGAYRVLARMARGLGEPDARWEATADTIARAMRRHLWDDARAAHAAFRYGRLAMQREWRRESLGEALAVLTGAVEPDRASRLSAALPVVAFGAPTFLPGIPLVPFYHNGSIWPFVTAFRTWAAAEAGHGTAVEHGLASLTRATALFLTNKENLVAETGHFEGTALNSDRQLWSVAGTLAASYRVLFGLRYGERALEFRPMVPPSYDGTRTLRRVPWRGAVLDITVRGHGVAVARAALDGVPIDGASLPDTLRGRHAVVLELDGRWPTDTLVLASPTIAPDTPVATLDGDSLRWAPVDGAVRYEVSRDGAPVDTVAGTAWRVARDPRQRRPALRELQVRALAADGTASFASEPARLAARGTVLEVEPDGLLSREGSGWIGRGWLPLAADTNVVVRLRVHLRSAGHWTIDARYANGSGPVNTEDKAAVRTVRIDGRKVGVLVMPQRGAGRWDEWGWTNALLVELAAGRHDVELSFGPLDRNMHGRISAARLDGLRLSRLAPAAAPSP